MRSVAMILAALALLAPGPARPEAASDPRSRAEPTPDVVTISMRLRIPRPHALRHAVVHDARDVADALRAAGLPFLGRLEFGGVIGKHIRHYHFSLWVDDVLTRWSVAVDVNPETRKIVDVSGALPRRLELPPRPVLSAEDAVAAVLEHLEADGERMETRPWIADGVHEAMLLLHHGELWWGVGIELAWRPDPVLTHEGFRVDPSGNVEPWVDGTSVP